MRTSRNSFVWVGIIVWLLITGIKYAAKEAREERERYEKDSFRELPSEREVDSIELII